MTGSRTRLLDALAGLLAAGLLVIGVVLLLAELIAPTALPAAGLGPAAGPGWSSVLAHLVVGGAGEVVVRLRDRWPVGVRAGADAAVIVAVLAVLWWHWWP
ncbi:hypothetical protein ACVBEQ_03255 [Nakamurella sp. GG22]